MQYQAKILTRDGRIEEQVLDASDISEARFSIERNGSRILGIQRTRIGGNKAAGGGKAFRLSIFNQQLLSLLDAGQPILDCIEILSRHDQHGQNRNIYEGILSGIRAGKQLSDAMEAFPRIFPVLYIAMIRSSETTGSVPMAIRRFADYQKSVDLIRGKLISAAIYPFILIAVGSLVVAFLMLHVVPGFAVVLEDVASKKIQDGGIVLLWGRFVLHHPFQAWGLFIGGIVTLLMFFLNQSTRRSLAAKLPHLPWVGHRIWLMQLARLYRTLGMLLNSGVGVIAAMRMAATSLPPSLASNWDAAVSLVNEGHPMSGALAETGMSTEVAKRLLVAGESSGAIAEMLHRVADFYDQETSAWIDTVGRFVEPVLMVGIGIVIGGIVLMLYMPIFDLASAI